MKILIKNGFVVDPENNIGEVRDILIKDSTILKVDKNINNKEKADEVIDAKDKIVMPAVFDMHVHLREPGREDKETIHTATKAALKGGVTSVLAMSNTTPAIDSRASIRLLKDRIAKFANVDVFISGTITKNRMGQQLSDISQLRREGAVAITDDGASVDNTDLFLKAIKKAKQERLLVVCHCEDKSISKRGVMNRGIVSTMLGLRGIPKESEYKRVQRDIDLAKKVGASLHVAHVSCKESVEIIAQAKKKGIAVSCDTTPHYFSLDEAVLMDYNTNFKMNPPLRTKEDVLAIRQGLKDGTIDAIASDHAPHTENEKDIEFEFAEFGVIGLETILAVSTTELISANILSWPELARKLSLNPARILKIDKGSLREKSAADIIIIDPNKEWIVKKDEFISKSKNSAFIGKKLKGCVEYTIYKGKIVFKR
jgi:dihydroorotase